MSASAGVRRQLVFAAGAADRERRRRGRELAARFAAVSGRVHEALDVEPPAAAAVPATPAVPAVEDAVDLAEHCLARLRDLGDPTAEAIADAPVHGSSAGAAGSGMPAEGGLRLCLLVLELHELAFDLGQFERDARHHRLGAVSAGLARLRSLPGSTPLLDEACGELVRRCGFGRAVLSRVEDDAWWPWMAYFSNGDEFESWFAGWVDRPIPLRGRTPEAGLLTDGQPVAVLDTARAVVHRPIIVESGRSASYVVAPLLQGTSVVGFLHADHHPAGRRVDAFDRDVLWAFADGFSHLYERAVLAERLRAGRDQARTILSSAVESMSAFCDAGLDLSPRAALGAMPPVAGPPAPARPGDGLTARESQVLDLMVAGAANAAIAAALVITEDTVKSHVKHILRKLGAVNRAQAIATALGLAGPGPRG
ncbi:MULTISPECIES: helix-turn-helix transcriptional regulator [Frankia]|uniref:Two-component system regulator n=1 Tax=Frankia alni (strain DSM 45986 / CECT 9034 / ACN14a) TaxID=326424 RepID=Q0RQ63_FRAAA|nr:MULTISPECIES: LuxR C-terminal-related transcriptional regulator [Frankia]CAJ60314.1 Putative two-component system regulator [Frankia alni ACN14a]